MADRPQTVESYLEAAAPEARPILERIRRIVRDAAPDAEEVISYRMPAFRRHGILLYVGAFEHHVGVFPPVTGDAALEKALAPYAGEKGNLRFPLDEPIPWELIERIVRLRVEQDEAKAEGRRRRRRGPACRG